MHPPGPRFAKIWPSPPLSPRIVDAQPGNLTPGEAAATVERAASLVEGHLASSPEEPSCGCDECRSLVTAVATYMRASRRARGTT